MKSKSCSVLFFNASLFVFVQIQEFGLQQQWPGHLHISSEVDGASIPARKCDSTDVRTFAATSKYLSETWIYSDFWPQFSWCVFMMTIRTNNYVEGWHHALHLRVSGR